MATLAFPSFLRCFACDASDGTHIVYSQERPLLVDIADSEFPGEARTTRQTKHQFGFHGWDAIDCLRFEGYRNFPYRPQVTCPTRRPHRVACPMLSVSLVMSYKGVKFYRLDDASGRGA